MDPIDLLNDDDFFADILSHCERMDEEKHERESRPKRIPLKRFDSLDFTQQFMLFGKLCVKVANRWYDCEGERKVISPNQMVQPLAYLLNGQNI